MEKKSHEIKQEIIHRLNKMQLSNNSSTKDEKNISSKLDLIKPLMKV